MKALQMLLKSKPLQAYVEKKNVGGFFLNHANYGDKEMPLLRQQFKTGLFSSETEA